MRRIFAFLRAVNVGGRTIRMEHLRGHFEAIGLKGAETFIASGNVIFPATRASAATIERRIESQLAAELGYEVRTFLRNESEIAAIVAHQPLGYGSPEFAGTLLVGFVAQPPTPNTIHALKALETKTDTFHVHGREVYWNCRIPQNESLVSNAKIERALEAGVTFRNINTINRLAKKYGINAGPP